MNKQTKPLLLNDLDQTLQIWQTSFDIWPYGGMPLYAVVAQDEAQATLLKKKYDQLELISSVSSVLESEINSYDDELSVSSEAGSKSFKIFLITETVFKKMSVNWSAVYFVEAENTYEPA